MSPADCPSHTLATLLHIYGIIIMAIIYYRFKGTVPLKLLLAPMHLGEPLFEMCCFHMGIAQIALDLFTWPSLASCPPTILAATGIPQASSCARELLVTTVVFLYLCFLYILCNSRLSAARIMPHHPRHCQLYS